MEIESVFPEKVLKDVFGHDKAARQAFIDAVEKIDLTQVDQFNRLPKNLMKKEGAGVYSFFPLGKKADARLVMTVDPKDSKKLVFYGFSKHNSQYGAMIRGAGDAYKKAVQQASRMPLSAGLTAKINEKVAKKTGAKLGTKAALKVGVKKVPGIGLVFGTIFAGMSAVKGDWQGAGMEFCSGLASCVPGWGTATSFAIDAALIAREAQKGR